MFIFEKNFTAIFPAKISQKFLYRFSDKSFRYGSPLRQFQKNKIKYQG